MAKNRAIVIGLDGATFALIEPWVGEGKLPNFRRLMREGAWGPLRSVFPPITPPAFASFLTGRNPGKHGVYDFYGAEPGGYGVRPVNGSSMRSETFADILSSAGRKVGLVNVPMTYPPRPVNGFVVTGMLTPAGVPYTYPEQLQQELDRMGYRIEVESWYHPGIEEQLLSDILDVERRRAKALDKLVREHPWDLLVCVFRSTDHASHYFWRFMDPQHPAYREENAARYGDYVYRAYRECDDILGGILDAIDDDVTLLVMSDHGFGRECKTVHLSNWLSKVGLLRFRRNALTRIKKLLSDLGLSADNIVTTVAALGLQPTLRRMSRDVKSRLYDALVLSYSDVDWSRTKAFSRGQIGQIYLNVRGRQPQGIVDPDGEYAHLRAGIVDALMELRDPDDGRPMVDRCYVKEEMYSGDCLNSAPDIFVQWRDMEYWAYHVLAGGRRIVAPNLAAQSGGHRMDGILLVRGPGVRPGYRVQEASILDLAPTLLHLLEVPVPRDMDGQVLRSVFDESTSIAQRPVTYSDGAGRVEEEYVYSKEEEKQILERLKQFGYE